MPDAKAWTFTSTKGGLSNNLHLTNIDLPDSKANHALVEILNVSLNPGDLKFPDVPIVGRFIKRPASPCFDFCGRIRALPADFRNQDGDFRHLHVGQVVFGMHRDLRTYGTLKTLMWIHTESLYPLPDGVPVEHGSALGIAAMTAYQAIAPYAKPNGKVLINGGSGGVGTCCIQVAKALNLYVVATCSEAGAQLCKDLGADEILDYKSASFLDDLRRTQVDLVVDTVGADPLFHTRSEEFLKPNGVFCLVGLMDRDWTGIRSMLWSWLLPAWLGGTPRTWKLIFTQNAISDYAAVATLASKGQLKVVVDSVFPFEDAPKALEKLYAGRSKGKIIVKVGDSNA